MGIASAGRAVPLIAALLLACAPPTPLPSAGAAPAAQSRILQWQSRYAALATQGRRWHWDAAASRVRIHVFRGGRAERLGHDHVITAPLFAGFAFVPDGAGVRQNFDAAQADVELRLDQLVVDAPQGGADAAAAGGVTPQAAAATRAHMLGDEGLQAARYPYAWIHLGALSGVPPLLAAQVDIELHGQRQTLLLPLAVVLTPEVLRVDGTFVLRQSDFGVQPYAVLGGLLAVRDALVVEYTLVGAPDGN